MEQQTTEIPTAHIDDVSSTSEVTDALKEIHGEPYDFSVQYWDDGTVLHPDPHRTSYHMVIEAENCHVNVKTDDLIRGPSSDGSYQISSDLFSIATDTQMEEIWPGDVISIGPEDDPVELTGSGTYFTVRTEQTPYKSARFGFLRNISDDVGGCAEYDKAFRREVLPPELSDDDEDARGVNRINQHTLDMRHDREPEPVQHCHAPVSCGNGTYKDHTETAILLDRSLYNLPPVEASDEHIRIFRKPREDASDYFDLSIEPGSIVVTPATKDRIYGHCFRNAFAVLIAVPSFTAPLIEIGKDKERRGETHRKYHED